MMNKIFTLVFAFLALLSWGQTTKKVLFLGNSYTGVNNLPGLIESIATADGNTLQHDRNTPGGYTFQGHSTNTTSLNKIEQDQWDYVVLQEQSQRPSFPHSQVQQDVYPYAEILVDSIYSNYECSTPLFYNTWGRRDGDSQWDSIDTFQEMNLRLHNAYDYMAASANGKNAPVGIGFQHVFYDANSPIAFADLYATDGSHPSIYGSFLAACIFNNMIFNTTSVGNTYLPSGMGHADANYLQTVADHVVYDVDSVRTNYGVLTQNTIQTNIAGLTVDFDAQLNNGTFNYWNFGDGNSSTTLNTNHTYTNAGQFDVYLVCTNNCTVDSTKTTIDLSAISSLLEEKNDGLNVYPNPSIDGQVNIQNLNGQTAQIFTIDGKFVKNIVQKTFSLTPGIYILRTQNTSRRIVVM